MSYVKKMDFVPPYWTQHLVIRSVISEILGVWWFTRCQ